MDRLIFVGLYRLVPNTIKAQPCGWHRRNGPLRRADNLVPAALWFADHRPQPAADPVVWGDRAPYGRMAANQLTEACGWEQIPRYLIRDRDRAYGEIFIRRVRSIGIRDRPTSPRSAVVQTLLQRHTHSFVIEQGCPVSSRH